MEDVCYHTLSLIHIFSLASYLLGVVLAIDMPTESSFPSIDIPNVGLWDFLFERTDREFADDKGMICLLYTSPSPRDS